MENSAGLTSFFSYHGVIENEIGRIGFKEHYWVSYNSTQAICPAPVNKTEKYLGVVRIGLVNPEKFTNLDVSPALEITSRATKPTSNSFACNSQSLPL
jgi:hypothetical protein